MRQPPTIMTVDIMPIKVPTATVSKVLTEVLTEWDEFRTLDFQRIFEGMYKPAFIFDGRNILDLQALREVGFDARGIGK